MKKIFIFLCLIAFLTCGAFAETADNSKPQFQMTVAEVEAKAKDGNADAQYNLGAMYATGQGVTKDLVEAAKWCQKSAEQGNVKAQVQIGYMYATGQGVTKDLVEAAKWYQKSAEQGDAKAQGILGFMYANGEGITKDLVEAARWYQKSAEQGNAMGQLILGNMYATGKGVTKDLTKAFEWYQKSAEQGNADAQASLGNMYATGQGVAKDPVEAAKWYQKSAEQGDADAQYILGFMYATGQGVVKDLVEAAKWCKKSSEQGNTSAKKMLDTILNLSRETANALGLPQFDSDAKWLNPTFRQMYDSKAIEWLQLYQLTGAGDSQAPYKLGVIYTKGDGVEKDEVAALAWYYLALSNGNKDIKITINILEQKLTPQQINRAQGLAKKIQSSFQSGKNVRNY